MLSIQMEHEKLVNADNIWSSKEKYKSYLMQKKIREEALREKKGKKEEQLASLKFIQDEQDDLANASETMSQMGDVDGHFDDDGTEASHLQDNMSTTSSYVSSKSAKSKRSSKSTKSKKSTKSNKSGRSSKSCKSSVSSRYSSGSKSRPSSGASVRSAASQAESVKSVVEEAGKPAQPEVV